MKQIKRNTSLVYIYTILFNTLFWFGIWLLYYLKFVDYKGVAIIQAVAMISSLLSEIPSGAFSDLIGRKWTLILASSFICIGEIIIARASGINCLIISVTLIAIGYSLHSGTIEALIYDTLLEKDKEQEYSLIISKVTTIKILTIAVTSILGSIFFNLNNSLPFYLESIFKFISIFIVLFIKEPKIDRQKFTFLNFIKQAQQGFKTLFKKEILKITLLA